MKCSECPQKFADKGNDKECRCSCHSSLPECGKPSGVSYIWDFRQGRMVLNPVTMAFLERMAGR